MKLAIDLIEVEVVRLEKEIERLERHLVRLSASKSNAVKYKWYLPHLPVQIEAATSDIVGCHLQIGQLVLAQVKLRGTTS